MVNYVPGRFLCIPQVLLTMVLRNSRDGHPCYYHRLECDFLSPLFSLPSCLVSLSCFLSPPPAVLMRGASSPSYFDSSV